MSMKFLKTVAGAAVSSLWEKVSGNVVVKDTSANVGIGTDDPSGNLHVLGTVAANAGVYQTIENAGTGYSYLSMEGDQNTYNVGVGGTGVTSADQGTFIIWVAGGGGQKLTIGTDDDVTVVSGNLVIGTAGKGIDFSAQTATTTGTTTAELLDHYEEGTWTAELKGLTSAATTPVTVTGCYTRIGRQVNLTAFFSNVDTSGASGSMAVSGYPFTPPSTDAFRAAGSTVTYGLSVPNKGLTPTNQGAVDRCQFYSPTDDGGWTEVNITAGSGKYLFLTITYVV
jgi:hypothetical protein